MKKLFPYLVIVFLAGVIASSGQAQQMMLGVRGGINNVIDINSLPFESLTSHTCIFAGGQVDYQFNTMWALSLQALYYQKAAHGTGYANAYTGYRGYADWTMTYLEIPLVGKVNFGHSIIRPYIFAGPSFGVLLSSIEKVHTGGGSGIPNGLGNTSHNDGIKNDTTINLTNSITKIEYSILVGAGISVFFASGFQLFVDAGYAFSATNIDNYPWDKAYSTYEYPLDLRLATGVLFPI
ncbi:MAG TPA: porin family protein [Candidatus Kapabacteria bacterium]|jgi:hypothetical protein|nr:porin family protein [Candidatus Kapabacteria bacterium]